MLTLQQPPELPNLFPAINLKLLVFAHLLWTAVMTGLALVLNTRYPYPQTVLWFRVTLVLLALTALSPLPVLWHYLKLLWLPPVTFLLATTGFVVYSVMVMRAHIAAVRRRR